MNNEISNKPCGCGNCEPVCTTCGRPWIVCKGECGCKKPCCCNKKVNFCEYGRMAHGCIRERAPECPMQAVIPSVVVESVSNLKNLADCFVHVTSINTTFYIDDKHRTMITWAGPVEVNNYDYQNNPLGLRSQTVYDFANNRAIYYNVTGNYEIYQLGGGEGVTRLTMSWEGEQYPESWVDVTDGVGPRIEQVAGYSNIIKFQIPNEDVQFENESTGETLTVSQVYDLAESGEKIILDHVPLGAYYPYSNDDIISVDSYADNVELSNFIHDGSSETTLSSYTGGAFVECAAAEVSAYFGVQITKASDSQEYSFFVNGRGKFQSY